MRWDFAALQAKRLVPIFILSLASANHALAAPMQKVDLTSVTGSASPIQKTQSPADVLTGALSGAIGAAVPAYPYPAPPPEPDYDYCFYDAGWHGPGYYSCGYAWRTGYGWGGDRDWGRAHGYDRHGGHGRDGHRDAHGGHFGPHGGPGGHGVQRAAFHGAPAHGAAPHGGGGAHHK